MNKTLIIRADANTHMGTGHVMRCIALGQAWQDAGGLVVFVSCCDSSPIKQRIADEGFKLIELTQAYPVAEDDLTRTIKVAEKAGAIWIVTDGYHFDLEYQQAVHRAGFKLLFVDDYNHLPEYEADILLNQNVGAEEIDYHCNPDCRRLLGNRYVMLRREFRAIRLRTRSRVACGSKVLVTMGGADSDNASLVVLQVVDLLGKHNLHVKVVIGSSNRNTGSLEKWVSGLSERVELLRSVDDMPLLMQWADYAIAAAGSTCWELMAMNVPFTTVIIADNQVEIAEKLAKQAGIPTAGWVDDGFTDRLKSILLRHLGVDHQISTEFEGSEVNRDGASLIVQALEKEG